MLCVASCRPVCEIWQVQGMAILPRTPVHAYLAEWRNHRGMTQQQVADTLNVTHTTVGRWENGEVKKIKDEDLERLAELYAISPRQLLHPVDQADMVKRLEQVQDVVWDMDAATFADFMIIAHRFRGSKGD